MVSGHLDALDLVSSKALAAGAMKATRLAVSGAFHTPLMEPARKELMKVRVDGEGVDWKSWE